MRETTLGASYGDAFLAALAVGAVERDGMEEWNRVARSVRAVPSPVYETGYTVYRKLYEPTRGLMRQI